jgi:transcription elongation factor Elf1
MGDAMEDKYEGDFYCLKCKKTVKSVGEITTNNGRRMAKGVCPNCGTKMTRILPKAPAK